MGWRMTEEEYDRLIKKRSTGGGRSVSKNKVASYMLVEYAELAINDGILYCPCSPMLVTLKLGVKSLRKNDGKPKPYERIEQAIALLWLERVHPIAFDMTTATPMGGYRPDGAGGQLKGDGVKRGFPDLLMDFPSDGYHGLRIEMKKYDRSANPSDNQVDWLTRLAKHGYRAVVCRGHQAAIQVISDYLKIESTAIDLPSWAIQYY